MVERALPDPGDIGYDDPDEITADTAIPEPEAVAAAPIEEPEDTSGALVIPPRPELPKVVRQKDLKKKPVAAPVDVGEGFDDPDAVTAPEPGVASKGSFIPEAGKAVAAGATEATGGMIKGAGGIRVEDMQRRLEEQARAEAIAAMQEEGLMPKGSALSGGLVDIENLPPEQKIKVKARLAEAAKVAKQIDLANDPFYKAGLATEEWSQKHFAAAKDYEDSWTRAIGEGLGSIAPYLVAGAVPGVGTIAGATAGYAGATGEAIDRAVKAGATKEQIMQAVRLGGIPGLSEQVSADILLEKIPLPAMGKVLGALSKIAGKAMAEGGQEGVSTVLQNVIEKYVYDPDQDVMEGVLEAAGMGAIIGGGIGAVSPGSYKGGKPKEDEDDEETVDEAGETQPEAGVVEPSPEAVQNPPGGVGTPPKQPAGTGAPAAGQPEVNTPETTAAPAAGVDPAIAAALGAPAATPAQPKGRKKKKVAPVVATPVAPEEDLEEDESAAIAEAVGAQTEEQLSATEARMRDLFKDETAAQATQAQQTKPAVPNADISAALASSKPAMPETLGTGRALGQAGATIEPPAPAAPAAQPSVPATPTPPARTQAQEPDTPLAPAAAAPVEEVAAFQAEPAPEPAVALAPAGTQLEPEPAAEPESGFVEPAPEPAPEPTPARERLRYEDIPITEEVHPFAKHLNRLRKITRELSDEEFDYLSEKFPQSSQLFFPRMAGNAASEQTVDMAEREWRLELAKFRKERQAREVATAEETKRQAKLAAIEERRTAGPPKAAEVKAKAKKRQASAAEPEKAPPTKGEQYKIVRKAEVEQEAAARQAEEERARQADVAAGKEAAAKEEARQAERKPLARQAEKKAHEVLNRTSTVTEPELEATYRKVLEEISDAVAAKIPDNAPPKAALYKATEAIVMGVKRRMAQLQEQADTERGKGTEVAKAEAKAKEEKEAKQKQMLEGKPQQRERATKGKQKSSAGILAESDDSVRREAERRPDDPLLQAWMALDAREKEIPRKNSDDYKENKARYEAELADITAKKRQLQEGRAAIRAKQEAEEAENAPMSERAQAVQAKAEAAIAAHPIPNHSAKKVQIQAAKAHLKQFVNATRGIQVAGRPDRKANSTAENLVIYARKLAALTSEPDKHATEFIMAQLYQQANATEEFYSLVLNEKIKGAEYREELGADEKAGSYKALHEDETQVTRPPSAITEIRNAYEMEIHHRGERKGGAREGARRAFTAQARDKTRYTGFHTIRVPSAVDNRMVEIVAETDKAASLLRELNMLAQRPETFGGYNDMTGENIYGEAMGGYISVIRSTLSRHLIDLVGDVDVHFISTADMVTISGKPALGVYFDYLDDARAYGRKPAVFLDEKLRDEYFNGHIVEYAHTLVHELVHAATSQAYRHDIRGTQKIIGKLRKEFRKTLEAGFTAEEMRQFDIEYGVSKDVEFIAEAFSNPNFQHVLAQARVPASLRREISALKLGRAPTWFEAFAGAVSNAVGIFMGTRGQTYMETMVALYPSITRSSVAQQLEAERLHPEMVALRRKKPGKAQAYARGPADVHALTREFHDRFDGMLGSAKNLFTAAGRKKVDIFATTGELIRRAEKYFGGPDNPFEKLARLLLSKDPLRAKYRALGADLELKLLELQKAKPKLYKQLSLFLHEASRFRIDPTKPLTDPSNRRAKGKGSKSVQRQAKHAEMAAEWNALPADVRATGQELIAHYRDMHEREGKALVKYTITQAIKKYHVGTVDEATVDRIVEWVRSGDAAANKGTQADKDFRQILGKSADTIAAVKELRRIDGLYVPLSRRGKFFISATEQPYGTLAKPKGLPAGATADASENARKDADPIIDRLLFKDRASLDAFTSSSDEMVTTGTLWIDPKTGKKVTKDFQVADPSVPGGLRQARAVYVATIQNKRMEMSDNKYALEKRRKELLDQGHKVAKVRQSKELAETGSTDVTSSQLQRLMNNLGQTTIGKTTIGQQAVEAALIDAHIRSLTTPGVLSRKLRRDGVMGYDLDLAGAAREYNQNAASHLANIELAPQYAEAEAELQRYIDNSAYASDSIATTRLQQMRNELHTRINSPHAGEAGGLSRAANLMMDVSYLRHLFSPHYSIMQMLQPIMTTIPVAGSKYGQARTWKHLVAAYKIGGIAKTLGKGFSETWQAGLNLDLRQVVRIAHEKGIGVHDALWVDRIKNEKDAAELEKVFAEIRELGFGAASGIEAGALSEADMTTAEKAVQRLSTVAKAIPEAAEGINRYVTAIVTYRMERENGATHAAAQRAAVLAVEQTQGGYSRANNPAFANNPLFRVPLQFKKYGLMYGQMFYGNLATSLNFKEDRATRVLAAKTWISMAAMTFVFAGVGGLPFIEMARILINMALLAGLEDDDWEDYETGMEQWFNDMAGWATGDEGIGDRLGEAAMHGLTRLVGVSTSNSMGADNLITFGQPKTMDEEGVALWMIKAFGLGAGGSMVWDGIKNAHNGDINGAIPWPKIVKNLQDAWKLYSEGSVSKTTGEEYHEPYSLPEAAVKALGFQPAEEARQWEAKGGGSLSRREAKLRGQRRNLMQRWVHNPDDRDAIREEIREFNDANPDDRITFSSLMKSKKAAKERKKEREKALEDM